MPSPPDDENPIVCFCFNVRRNEVQAVIARPDVHSVIDITAHCKAGNGCSSCWSLLEDMLSQKPLL